MVNSGLMVCNFSLKKRFSRGEDSTCFLNDRFVRKDTEENVTTYNNIFEVFDAFFEKHGGFSDDEKKMKMFGNIILERILDGICVFLILFAAVMMYCKQPWILNLSYLVGAIFIGSFVGFYLIFKLDKVDFVCDWLIKIGGVVMLVGGVMFALSFQREDAEGKSRALMTIMAGGMVVGIALSKNLFGL